jgi:outer membrane protein insertion porin family
MLLELDSSVGELVTRARLASDLRRLWSLGFFEDVRVEGELTPRGVLLTYVVTERPTIRKIVVEGNDKVKLDDINEALDLEKNEVLDLSKVRTTSRRSELYRSGLFWPTSLSCARRRQASKVDLAIVVSDPPRSSSAASAS